jgi:hypothetical protein
MEQNHATPVHIFISYAHEDSAWLDKLQRHLGGLRHLGRVQAFDDRDILAGSEWEPKIKAALDTAHIIVLIVTANFLDSAYCTTIELQRALARHNDRSVYVVPIIAEHADWQALSIGRLALLPKDEQNNLRPLSDWPNVNKPLADIAMRIRQLAEQWREEQKQRDTVTVTGTPSPLIDLALYADRARKKYEVIDLSALA